MVRARSNDIGGPAPNGGRRAGAARRCCELVLLAGTLFPLPATAQDAATRPPVRRSPRDEIAPPSRTPRAVTLSAIYTSDANANLRGGLQTGAAYLQRIGLIGDVDLHAAIGWRGARAHVSVHSIIGTGLSGRRVGNVLTVSGIEAAPTLRLFNLWIEQKFGDRATLRVGQFNVDQDFAISPTASLFVNSTFGWPGSFATDLPSGGPAYPLATPGISLAVTATRRTAIRLAVFAGDPAGPGDGDPQRRNADGLNGLRFAGAPFVIGEVTHAAGGDDPSWSFKLGGWVHFDRFSDLGRDGNGVSLAAPDTTGIPQSHPGNVAIYAIGDTRLWRAQGRALHAFARVTASPANRNAVDLYADAGLVLSGPFRARPNDALGLGVAVARLSPRLRALRAEACAVAAVPCRPPPAEIVVEASYQLHVGERLHVQPNVQLVVHPANGLVASPAMPSEVPPNAVVVGLRTSLRL